MSANEGIATRLGIHICDAWYNTWEKKIVATDYLQNGRGNANGPVRETRRQSTPCASFAIKLKSILLMPNCDLWDLWKSVNSCGSRILNTTKQSTKNAEKIYRSMSEWQENASPDWLTLPNDKTWSTVPKGYIWWKKKYRYLTEIKETAARLSKGRVCVWTIKLATLRWPVKLVRNLRFFFSYKRL